MVKNMPKVTCVALLLMIPDLVRVALRPDKFKAASPLRVGPFCIGESVSAETALWRAVILRAMRDAAGEVETSNLKRDAQLIAVRIAQGWFRRADEGFQTICDYAGLNAQCVRRAAMAQFVKLPKAPKQNPRKRLLMPGKLAA
jgi:hypothetical protein